MKITAEQKFSPINVMIACQNEHEVKQLKMIAEALFNAEGLGAEPTSTIMPSVRTIAREIMLALNAC